MRYINREEGEGKKIQSYSKDYNISSTQSMEKGRFVTDAPQTEKAKKAEKLYIGSLSTSDQKK